MVPGTADPILKSVEGFATGFNLGGKTDSRSQGKDGRFSVFHFYWDPMPAVMKTRDVVCGLA